MALKNELRTQGDFLFKHRSYLPVIIIIIGLYVYIQQQYAFTQLGATNQLNYELLCLVISLFGLFIRIVTIGYSGKNTSGRNTKAGQIADSVNTTGMYSLCRHPLYVGNFFMWLGIAILTQNFWFIIAFVLFYWLYYERIMYAEETFLIANYGEAYTNWSKKTPAFVFDFSKWESPIHAFSWKKIIRQEKSGILNLFVVFFVFDNIKYYIQNESFNIQSNIWTYCLVLAILWYISIKLIQKNTTFLKQDR